MPWAACRAEWPELYDQLVVARIAAAHRPLDEARILNAALARAVDPVERRLVGEILAGDDAAREVYADWLEATGGDRDGWSPRARAVYEVGKIIRPIPPASLPQMWSGVVVFASADYREMFRTQHLDHAAERWREVDPQLGIAHAIAVEDLQRYAFDDFWDAGAIRAAFLVEQHLEPHFVGLYEFGCSYSGPYRLRAKPREPLLLAELPEPVRGQLGALEMPRTSFDTADEIDPERHFDCQVYGR